MMSQSPDRFKNQRIWSTVRAYRIIHTRSEKGFIHDTPES
jgi:hypothetical protein